MNTTILLDRWSGQGLVEYGLIILLVALVVIGALSALGVTLNTVFYETATNAI